jgi:ubiquinone/menaquinone biosynthesis C-methylase UbiE
MSERNCGQSRSEFKNINNIEHGVTKKVREFYERFHFPGVRPADKDGLILMRRMAKYVSNRCPQRSKMRVLDAGCGTGNTVISLAHRFGDVDFLGIDISEPSLSQAEQTASDAGLQNLRFKSWDLMTPFHGEEIFDVILCLGVLHHTADMEHVLLNLRSVLKDEGELYLWIYGSHGRYRHALNRRLLEMLLDAKEEPLDSLSFAKEFAFKVGHGAILGDLLGNTLASSKYKEILGNPAWLADQFLHPNEILINMEKLLLLVARSGLEFDTWLGIPNDISKYVNCPEVLERFDLLPGNQRLIALDLLLKPEHYFTTLRKSVEQKGGLP